MAFRAILGLYHLNRPNSAADAFSSPNHDTHFSYHHMARSSHLTRCHDLHEISNIWMDTNMQTCRNQDSERLLVELEGIETSSKIPIRKCNKYSRIYQSCFLNTFTSASRFASKSQSPLTITTHLQPVGMSKSIPILGIILQVQHGHPV